MATPRPPIKGKPIIPLGQPLDWKPAEIQRRSETTEEDKVAAIAFWQANAPRSMRDLLNALAHRR
jgi:hypothetical protein